MTVSSRHSGNELIDYEGMHKSAQVQARTLAVLQRGGEHKVPPLTGKLLAIAPIFRERENLCAGEVGHW